MPKKRNRYGVEQRGKKWIACPWIPGQNRHKWAGTFDTEQEATAAAIAKIEELRRLPKHLETIKSFCGRWVNDYPRPKESTNDAYRAAAKRFSGSVDPDDKRKLNEYPVSEARLYAKRHPYDAPKLSAMFGDARREDLILPESNPFSKLGISKGRGRKDIIAITPEELDLLLELAHDAHGEEFGPMFAAVIEVAADTTMRPSEIFGLDVPDLQGEEIAIERQFYKRRIQPPKRGPRRLPFIPPRAAQALATRPRRLPKPICPVTENEMVFCGKEAQRITQPALSSYWKPVKVAFEAAIPKARREELRKARNPKDPTMDFYELRHFGATQMAERGVEPWVAAVMMGHDDGGKLFEDTYSHPRDEIARERLKRAFAQNVQPLRAVEDTEVAGG